MQRNAFHFFGLWSYNEDGLCERISSFTDSENLKMLFLGEGCGVIIFGKTSSSLYIVAVYYDSHRKRTTGSLFYKILPIPQRITV